MTVVSIAIVDDHRVVSRGLEAYFASFPTLRVVGTAASGEELLCHLERWQPDVVVQDLLMPGGMDGLEATRRTIERRPKTRVVALTASTDEARMMAALRAGASGYVRKDAQPEVLLAAVRAVAAGRTFIDPALGRPLARGRPAPDDLTPREGDVLRHLAFGRTNAEIASALGVSEETVKTHVGHVLSKLQVENRAQAAVQALKRGLIAFEDLA